eukprot:scaffold246149_cov27-Tisochrysis_lutea.AAC.2
MLAESAAKWAAAVWLASHSCTHSAAETGTGWSPFRHKDNISIPCCIEAHELLASRGARLEVRVKRASTQRAGSHPYSCPSHVQLRWASRRERERRAFGPATGRRGPRPRRCGGDAAARLLAFLTLASPYRGPVHAACRLSLEAPKKS